MESEILARHYNVWYSRMNKWALKDEATILLNPFGFDEMTRINLSNRYTIRNKFELRAGIDTIKGLFFRKCNKKVENAEYAYLHL